MTKTYNLFLSHAWDYGDAYEKLVKILNGRNYFSWKNFSVPMDDPIHCSTDKELRKAITNKIALCHVVVVLAGVYSTYRKWINIEIALAQSFDKPIVAIEPWGSERTSATVKDAADLVVKWNTDSIVDAIRTLG